MTPMLRLLAFITAHALLARVVPVPWGVPNLTLIGLVQASGSAPRRWLPFSLIAGCSAAMWAARAAGPLLLSYLLIGALMKGISGQLDTLEPRAQALLAAGLCVPLTAGWVWLDGHWSWTLAGWSLAHMMLTGAAALLLRRRAMEPG